MLLVGLLCFCGGVFTYNFVFVVYCGILGIVCCWLFLWCILGFGMTVRCCFLFFVCLIALYLFDCVLFRYFEGGCYYFCAWVLLYGCYWLDLWVYRIICWIVNRFVIDCIFEFCAWMWWFVGSFSLYLRMLVVLMCFVFFGFCCCACLGLRYWLWCFVSCLFDVKLCWLYFVALF